MSKPSSGASRTSGYKVHLSRGEARTIIGIIGADEHMIHEGLL